MEISLEKLYVNSRAYWVKVLQSVSLTFNEAVVFKMDTQLCHFQLHFCLRKLTEFLYLTSEIQRVKLRQKQTLTSLTLTISES